MTPFVDSLARSKDMPLAISLDIHVSLLIGDAREAVFNEIGS